VGGPRRRRSLPPPTRRLRPNCPVPGRQYALSALPLQYPWLCPTVRPSCDLGSSPADALAIAAMRDVIRFCAPARRISGSEALTRIQMVVPCTMPSKKVRHLFFDLRVSSCCDTCSAKRHWVSFHIHHRFMLNLFINFLLLV
jgi:hypothetical protein